MKRREATAPVSAATWLERESTIAPEDGECVGRDAAESSTFWSAVGGGGQVLSVWRLKWEQARREVRVVLIK